MARKMTRTTLSSGKVTLSVSRGHRFLVRKIQTLAERTKKSVSEQVWDLCEQALEKQDKEPVGVPKVPPLPAADLGRVLIKDREELYDDVLADRL
jgi:hypothetical protein